MSNVVRDGTLFAHATSGGAQVISQGVTLNGITAGDTIAVVVAYDVSANPSGVTTSVTDDLSASAVFIARDYNASMTERVEHWYFPNHGGGNRTFTVLLDHSEIGLEISVIPLQNVDLVTPIAGSNHNTGNSSTPTSNAVTPATTRNGSFILGSVVDASLPTSAGSFTSIFNDGAFQDIEGLAQSTAGAVSATWTSSANDYVAVVSAFQPAAGGGGGSVAPKEAPQVLRQKRRTRKIKATQIKAKRQGNQARKPVKGPLVVKGRRRKPQRTIKVSQTKAKRQGNPARKPRVSSVVAKGRRRKPQRVLKVTQIQAKRQGNQARKPVKQPLIVKGRRRKPQRTLESTQIRAKRLNVVAPATFRAPDILIVKAPRRHKRPADATIIKGATRGRVIRTQPLIVRKKKRPIRLLTTQVSAALLAQPAVPRSGKPLQTVLVEKRRKRQGKAIQLRAKLAGNQPVKPSRSVKLYAKKRRKRTGDSLLVQGARRAPVSTPRAPTRLSVQVSAKRRRHRLGTVLQIDGARRAPVVAARAPTRQVVQVNAKRRRHRVGDVIQLRRIGARVFPKRPLMVLKKRRKLRAGDVTQVRAKRLAPATPRTPKKTALQVETARSQSRRRHKKTTSVRLSRAKFAALTRQYPSLVVDYSGPLYMVLSFGGPKMLVVDSSSTTLIVSRKPS